MHSLQTLGWSGVYRLKWVIWSSKGKNQCRLISTESYMMFGTSVRTSQWRCIWHTTTSKLGKHVHHRLQVKTPSMYHHDYHIIMCPHSKARLSLEVTAGCQQVAHWSASPATATERTTRASATKAKGWRERCSGTDMQLRISSKLQLRSN